MNTGPRGEVRLVLGWWTIAISLTLVAMAGYLAFRTWWEAKLIAATIDRIAPALLEPEAFFALVEISRRRSHFLQRHGPMLRLDEARERALTGTLAASGLVGGPVSSSRWLSHEDLLCAVRSALGHWSQGARPVDGVYRFKFPQIIGVGYVRGSDVQVATDLAIVVLKGKTVITAYPVVDEARSCAWHEADMSEVVSR